MARPPPADPGNRRKKEPTMDRIVLTLAAVALALAAAFPTVPSKGDAAAHARPGHSLNVHEERPTGLA
jgi:hypothetical protein